MGTNEANQVKYVVGSGGNISFYPAVDYDRHTACFVRCNQCMSLGYAWYGDEICPVCGEYGAIMDLKEVQDD